MRPTSGHAFSRSTRAFHEFLPVPPPNASLMRSKASECALSRPNALLVRSGYCLLPGALFLPYCEGLAFCPLRDAALCAGFTAFAAHARISLLVVCFGRLRYPLRPNWLALSGGLGRQWTHSPTLVVADCDSSPVDPSPIGLLGLTLARLTLARLTLLGRVTARMANWSIRFDSARFG